MKGQITVYYDLPNLALYFERVGNKVKEEHVQDIIAEMLKQAVALHMNEEADTISGTLMEMFVSSLDKTHTFENLPTDALRVYFGENETMILCSIPFSLIHLSLYQMPSSYDSPSSTAFITEDMSNPVLSPLVHPSGLSAQSFMCFLIFFKDCVTI